MLQSKNIGAACDSMCTSSGCSICTSRHDAHLHAAVWCHHKQDLLAVQQPPAAAWPLASVHVMVCGAGRAPPGDMSTWQGTGRMPQGWRMAHTMAPSGGAQLPAAQHGCNGYTPLQHGDQARMWLAACSLAAPLHCSIMRGWAWQALVLHLPCQVSSQLRLRWHPA
jgi:hypothetical protein